MKEVRDMTMEELAAEILILRRRNADLEQELRDAAALVRQVQEECVVANNRVAQIELRRRVAVCA